MSTDNAAQFYWAKLDRATAIFKEGNLDEAQDICCQLMNEFRCPRFCQIEARALRADCFPDNYWFAKSSLDGALEICITCESDPKAGEADLAELARVKKGVEAILQDRLTKYRAYWKDQGRDPPPSEDEWYEIADAQEPGEDDIVYEPVLDEDGEPITGPVPRWPFMGSAPPSQADMQKFTEGKRQDDERKDEEVVEGMEPGMEEVLAGVDETAQKLRKLKISEGLSLGGDKDVNA